METARLPQDVDTKDDLERASNRTAAENSAVVDMADKRLRTDASVGECAVARPTSRAADT